MPQSKYMKPFECTICKKKRYKSAVGLSRHKNAKHSNYNIPSIQSYICQKVLLMNEKKCSYMLSTNNFLLLFEKPANK